jgi:hypothetical protein
MKTEEMWANATPADWKNRVRGITFVINSSRAEGFPSSKGSSADEARGGRTINTARAAMLIASACRVPRWRSYADPRVAVSMSPAGPSDRAGGEESWTN